jgi:SET domain-containing protein
MNKVAFLEKIKAVEDLLLILNCKEEEIFYDLYYSLFIMPEPLRNKMFSFYEFVELKQSVIHGQGLFAKQNIKKGSVITIYPCDTLVNEKTGLCMSGSKNQELYIKYSSNYKLCCGDYSIIGFPDKKIFHGHFINDACPCVDEILQELLKEVNYKSFNKSNIKFMLKSLDRINCKVEYNKSVAYIVASRDICPGEEILMSYGLAYWTDIKKITIKEYFDKYFKEITANQRRYIYNLMNTVN